VIAIPKRPVITMPKSVITIPKRVITMDRYPQSASGLAMRAHTAKRRPSAMRVAESATKLERVGPRPHSSASVALPTGSTSTERERLEVRALLGEHCRYLALGGAVDAGVRPDGEGSRHRTDTRNGDQR
jgi:hypothetical protein